LFAQHRKPVAVLTAAACVALLGLAASASAATWSVAYPPFTPIDNVPYAPLSSIAAISATDVWSVGQNSGDPLIENWNGTKWSNVALPNGECDVFENSCVLTGVSGDSASDVIAVGHGTINSNSSAGWLSVPLAFHWNGSGWTQMTLPSSMNAYDIQHIQVFSPTNVWALGGTNAWHFDGGTWTEAAPVLAPPTGFGLSSTALSGSSPSDIWAVGVAQTSGYHNRRFASVIAHYNGSTWSTSSVPDQSGLVDVKAISPTDAWAVAGDGNTLNWNGSTWSVVAQVPYGKVIAALSPTDVYVAGVVSIAHFNGSTWTTQPMPSAVLALYGGAAFAPGHVWFAGISALNNGDEVPLVVSTTNG
jgi:hypothetical protein